MDLAPVGRLWRRLEAALGLAPLPPGYRPDPGAGMRRMMFAFVWLILGVIQTSIYLSTRDAAVLGLAALWFVLAALDILRARRILLAERRLVDAGEAGDDRDDRDDGDDGDDAGAGAGAGGGAR